MNAYVRPGGVWNALATRGASGIGSAWWHVATYGLVALRPWEALELDYNACETGRHAGGLTPGHARRRLERKVRASDRAVRRTRRALEGGH